MQNLVAPHHNPVSELPSPRDLPKSGLFFAGGFLPATDSHPLSTRPDSAAGWRAQSGTVWCGRAAAGRGKFTGEKTGASLIFSIGWNLKGMGENPQACPSPWTRLHKCPPPRALTPGRQSPSAGFFLPRFSPSRRQRLARELSVFVVNNNDYHYDVSRFGEGARCPSAVGVTAQTGVSRESTFSLRQPPPVADC